MMNSNLISKNLILIKTRLVICILGLNKERDFIVKLYLPYNLTFLNPLVQGFFERSFFGSRAVLVVYVMSKKSCPFYEVNTGNIGQDFLKYLVNPQPEQIKT